MVAHDIADTAYLIDEAAGSSKEQWLDEISPGQVVLEWDGAEPSVGAVLGAIVWTKEVWLATHRGPRLTRRASAPIGGRDSRGWPHATVLATAGAR